jgi:hypothetical protein
LPQWHGDRQAKVVDLFHIPAVRRTPKAELLALLMVLLLSTSALAVGLGQAEAYIHHKLFPASAIAHKLTHLVRASPLIL